ncbi:MAG TPA: hypothetical protein VGL13_17590 [Polyangiaceae bacterium]
MNKVRCTWASLAAALALTSVSMAARAANPSAAECLASNNAALRSDNEHRFREERAELLACAAPSCPADIRKECIRRADEIGAAIPTVVFEAKDASGNDLSAVKVTMDREVLTERLDGMAIPVDPGAHTFTLEAPGFPAVQRRFIIRERQRDRLERITFDAGATATSAVTPAVMATVPAPRSAASDEEPSRSAATKVFAILTAGVGVAGVAVGTVFGFQARSKRDEASVACPNVCANSQGVDQWHDAKTAGNISTIGFIVGGVGLATGAIIWIAGKPEQTSAPSAQVGLLPGGLAVSGRW